MTYRQTDQPTNIVGYRVAQDATKNLSDKIVVDTEKLKQLVPWTIIYSGFWRRRLLSAYLMSASEINSVFSAK